jgi:hypothetical protein
MLCLTFGLVLAVSEIHHNSIGLHGNARRLAASTRLIVDGLSLKIDTSSGVGCGDWLITSLDLRCHHHESLLNVS